MKKHLSVVFIFICINALAQSQYKISGLITYDNKIKSALEYSRVMLTDTLNHVLDSAFTNSSGNYSFNRKDNGTYKIIIKPAYIWGGANPVDALQVNRNYIKLFNFSDALKKKSADVNRDGVINPVDALLINRRYLKLVSSFKAGDWLIDSNTIKIAGNDITRNIKIICTGDVDGSYNPACNCGNFQLRFAGSGASTLVDSVNINNITQCATMTINGTDILNLDVHITKSLKDMHYITGDLLKLTGYSGIYSTVVMLVPANSQTVTFNFVPCTDADNNHYAVVQIGSQVWMEENLKTKHYRNGDSIPNVKDSAAWSKAKTGAYCDFHNLVSEGNTYGHLYNWYAVADNRKICPVGWHVSTNGEWNIMEKFLDNTVDTTMVCGGVGKKIGRILKENCNTRWAYLDSTWGTNASGFTALCSNFRTAIGGWSLAPDNNHDDSFWTSTAFNSGSAWSKSCRWCYSNVFVCGYIAKTAGSSVRCIKD